MTYYEQQVKEIGARFEQKEYLYSQLNEAKSFIHANFSQTITIGHIASAACFSKFHFLRLFKSVYQCTPHEYMTGLRIKKAKQLLQEGYTTGEVCETVGYSSMGTFKLLFKKHTRHTPHGYRQHIKRNNSETHSLTVSLFFKFYKKAISETGRTRCNHQFCDSPTNELCE